PEEVLRVVEVRMVEDVEEVRAEAERYPFRDLEVLVDGEVRVKEPGTTVLVALLRRKRSIRGRSLKGCSIEALTESVGASSLAGIGGSANDLRRDVGNVGVVVANARGRVEYGKRQTRAGEEVLRQSPAAKGS